MARSIKKGPFCDDHLMKKVLEQKATGEKKTTKTAKAEAPAETETKE